MIEALVELHPPKQHYPKLAFDCEILMHRIYTDQNLSPTMILERLEYWVRAEGLSVLGDIRIRVKRTELPSTTKGKAK